MKRVHSLTDGVNRYFYLVMVSCSIFIWITNARMAGRFKLQISCIERRYLTHNTIRTNESRTQQHRSLKLGLRLNYLNLVSFKFGWNDPKNIFFFFIISFFIIFFSFSSPFLFKAFGEKPFQI